MLRLRPPVRTPCPMRTTSPCLSGRAIWHVFLLKELFFPVEDVLAVLREHLRPEHKGKLDVLDLEGWRLFRHVFMQGRIDSHSAPLNNVLDYSGH